MAHQFDSIPKALQEKLINLVCGLSPENLTGDGELSTVQVRNKYADLMKEWRTLEKEAGMTIDYEDFEMYFYSK